MPVPNIYEDTGPTSGVGALSVPWGTHNASFVAVLLIQSNGETISQPVQSSGPATTWNLIAEVYTGTPGAAGSVGLAAYWARSTSDGGMQPVTVADTGDHTIAKMWMLQNVASSGNPINFAVTQSVDTAQTAVSVAAPSSTVPNCLVLCACGNAIDSATGQGSSGWTNAALTGVGFAGQFNTANGNGGGYMGGVGSKVTAGACGTFTHGTGWPTATKQANIVFAISDTATVSAASGSLTATGKNGTGTASATVTASASLTAQGGAGFLSALANQGQVSASADNTGGPGNASAFSAVTVSAGGSGVGSSGLASILLAVALTATAANVGKPGNLSAAPTPPVSLGVGPGAIIQRENSTNPSTGTLNTPSITTDDGATFLVGVSKGQWSTAPSGCSDSFGNVYSLIGEHSYDEPYTYSRTRLDWSLHGTGGAGHYASATWGNIGGTGDEITPWILQLNGVNLLQDHSWVSRPLQSTSAPIVSNSVRATAPCLLIAVIWGNGPTGQTHGFTFLDGFTKIAAVSAEGDPWSSGYIQCSIAYKLADAGTHTVRANGTFNSGSGQWEGGQIYLMAFQAVTGVDASADNTGSRGTFSASVLHALSATAANTGAAGAGTAAAQAVVTAVAAATGGAGASAGAAAVTVAGAVASQGSNGAAVTTAAIQIGASASNTGRAGAGAGAATVSVAASSTIVGGKGTGNSIAQAVASANATLVGANGNSSAVGTVAVSATLIANGTGGSANALAAILPIATAAATMQGGPSVFDASGIITSAPVAVASAVMQGGSGAINGSTQITITANYTVTGKNGVNNGTGQIAISAIADNYGKAGRMVANVLFNIAALLPDTIDFEEVDSLQLDGEV